MSHPTLAAPERCPLCGGAARPVLARLRFIARAPYYRCAGCDLLHARLDAARERRFYEEVYPRLPHKRLEPAARLPLFQRFLDRHGATPRRLLDIGCGAGHFLALARARGWEAAGVELGAAAAREAQELSGAPVYPGGIEAVPPELRFDLITLWNVLDQVADPLGLSRAALGLLARGGALFVRVPNGAFHRPLMALVALLGPRGRGLAGLTPLHPWLLRPADLERLLRLAGFARVELRGAELTRARPSRAAGALALSPLGAAKRLLGAAATAAERLSAGRLCFSPSLEALAYREEAA